MYHTRAAVEDAHRRSFPLARSGLYPRTPFCTSHRTPELHSNNCPLPAPQLEKHSKKILPKKRTRRKTTEKTRRKHALLHAQPRQIRAIHVDKVGVPDHLGRPGGVGDGGAWGRSKERGKKDDPIIALETVGDERGYPKAAHKDANPEPPHPPPALARYNAQRWRYTLSHRSPLAPDCIVARLDDDSASFLRPSRSFLGAVHAIRLPPATTSPWPLTPLIAKQVEPRTRTHPPARAAL
ncbi:hypothetical protein B0H13DRAFT_2446766 [Mycena leptocephala]|nr:hypothetical protein B0H13DRAFT_2446766 [Mycena leptocephala]